jgi:lysophospholipid acyltransferase (LPLAT)-like uncharacterized protein
MRHAGKSLSESEPPKLGLHFDARPQRFSLWRRMQVRLVAGAVYCVVRTLGPTLRYEVLGWHHSEQVYAQRKQCIWAFWHRAIFGIIWWGRNHGVVIMHSANFDGRWAGEIAQWMGYGVAHGSATRGGLRGLAVMARRLEEGRDVAFTIDGPRGPRFVAKPGPVMLARRTGFPILVFHTAVERAHTFEKSWDLFQVPYPFSRAVMIVAPPVRVPTDADRVTLEAKHAEMRAALERCRELAESWFGLPPEERGRQRVAWNA